jgi:hypothetical protein
MDLKTSLKRFVDIFHSSPESLGNLEITKQPVKLQPPFPLGNALTEYFSHLHFEKPATGGQFHLSLFSPEQLETAQQGWRWIRTDTGALQEDNIHWNRNWTIIAERHGDVIFVDEENGKVFGSIQKRNFFISSSVSAFFDVLAECIEIENNKYHNDTVDEDFNPLPNFIEEIKLTTLNKLGPEGSEGFIKFFFG